MLEQEAKAEAEVTNNNTNNNNFNSTFLLSPPLPSPPPFHHPLVRNNGHTWEDTVDAARALRDRHNSHSFLLVGAILALLLLAGYTRLLQPPGVLPFFSFSSSDLRGTEVFTLYLLWRLHLWANVVLFAFALLRFYRRPSRWTFLELASWPALLSLDHLLLKGLQSFSTKVADPPPPPLGITTYLLGALLLFLVALQLLLAAFHHRRRALRRELLHPADALNAFHV
ncbi:hypothetical protein TYRP_023625 [Tyrophagus putrescentiae]|nr:hypothetical protein TYRP_023625 [Tyrophagus putrescentiae]